MRHKHYPIRVVSQRTGLSIDTLRAWERRYGAVVPERSQRGRVYSETDMERLELLRRCVESGYSIGQIAHWDNTKLREVLSDQQDRTKTEDPAQTVARWFNALKSYDYKLLDSEMTRSTILYPPPELVRQIAVPFIRAVGDFWMSGNLTIAQEHLASATLRNLLGSLIRFYTPGEGRKLLFTTPRGELHEFGILAGAMLAVAARVNVLYLGPNLPNEEILNTVKMTSPAVVVLGWKGATRAQQTLMQIKKLAEKLPQRVQLWIGGVDMKPLQDELRKTRATLLPDFEDFKRRLSQNSR